MKFDIWGFLENLSISFNFHSNLTRITGTLHDDKYTFMIISAHFFLEWEIFRTKIVEKIKTHILYSLTFLRKSCLLWDNVEKLCRTGRATDDDKAYALFMLDTDTHSSYVTVIAFSNSTVVAPARLYVTLFVHCLSCFPPPLTSQNTPKNSRRIQLRFRRMQHPPTFRNLKYCLFEGYGVLHLANYKYLLLKPFILGTEVASNNMHIATQ